jgi:sugar lactone lactonase YvrE
MSLSGFRLGKDDIGYLGAALSRPECVLAEADGTLWVSDNRCGVTRIDRDGGQCRIGRMGGNPNGLAMDDAGNLLVANVIDGALYRLQRDGAAETIIDSFAGRPLGAVNFVYRDGFGDRLWLSVSTLAKPVDGAVRPTVADGYVLRLDGGKARMAASGFLHTNELRIDRARRFLYVAETRRGRIRRLPLAADGTLGPAETFGPEPIFPGARVDGLAFDAAGNLWITEVSRNGIHVIAPDGACHCIFEDPAGATLPFPSSLAFGGSDLRTVYVGSVRMTRLAMFRSPVAGEPLAHWRR